MKFSKLSSAIVALATSTSALAHSGHHHQESWLEEAAHIVSHWNHLSVMLGAATIVGLIAAGVFAIKTVKKQQAKAKQQ